MKVKLFDEGHEHDLEIKVNQFLKSIPDAEIIDIKYQVTLMYDERDQICCFTCMIIYDEKG